MMWLFALISSAMAGPIVTCDQDIVGPELSVGVDLISHSGGGPRPQFDVMATFPVWSCLRAGFRVHEATEGELTMWDNQQYLGAFIKTHGAIGAEVHGPLNLTLASYALVGVKTASVLQRQGEDSYRAVNVTPSVYSYSALRWRPTPRFGLHVDFSIPINDGGREKGWYENRMMGIGFDVRLGKAKR